MDASIFSTYSAGENRVTASILAVFRAIALPRAERLLGGLMEQPDFQLVRFQNQPSKGAKGVPDAAITASVQLLVETKLTRNAVEVDQLRRHLARLDNATEATKQLLVLTPDDGRPAAIEAMADERLVWASFATLDQGIDELLEDKAEVVSEREAFLLRELQLMLTDEGLLGSVNEVVVVAARRAWSVYQKYHAYLCQPGRSFQKTERMAFYSQGRIYPEVPVILAVHDNVLLRLGAHTGELGALVDRFVADEPGYDGGTQKVFLLSPPGDTRTQRLAGPVTNDITTEAGRPWAFTLGQRYVSMERLSKAKKTSELVAE